MNDFLEVVEAGQPVTVNFEKQASNYQSGQALEPYSNFWN